MYTTEDTLYYPPVTTNKLDASQRVRLMRSTRKLGAILGTTPRLMDPEPIPITFLPIGRASTSSYSSDGHDDYVPKHAYASSYKHSPHSKGTPIYNSLNSSASSIALPSPQSSADVLPMPKSFSARPRRSKEAPHPLVLRYNTVSVDADDVRVTTPPSSPFTARPLPEIPSPVTPSAPTEAEMRRKRMAKLNRTFGENVPPEMVFRPNATTPRDGKPLPPLPSPKRDEVCITPPPRRSSRVWVTGNNAGTWTGEWNRRDIKEVQQQLRMLKAR